MMRIANLRQWWAALFPVAAVDQPAADRSSYERFALPHAFKPRLSLGEAVVATLGTLLRIFLGSLLFAIWGSYAWFAWTALPNYLLRVVVILPMFLLFLVCMLLLLSAIGALQRAVWPKHP